jgi:2,3-diketo-5-methylthio-1-phosphopentane phosphatase
LSLPSKILITDFDGTFCTRDFFELAVRPYLDPASPDYWSQYSAGRITHFDAMSGFFGHIRCTAAEMDEVLHALAPVPETVDAIAVLRAQGWDVWIVSNGCEWYIRAVLGILGVNARVIASPGEFEPARGLRMSPPTGSPYYNPAYGIEKLRVFEEARRNFETVAFAGNGPPDLACALAARPELRFARTWLANELRRRGESFHSFHHWCEIAGRLLQGRRAEQPQLKPP